MAKLINRIKSWHKEELKKTDRHTIDKTIAELGNETTTCENILPTGQKLFTYLSF